MFFSIITKNSDWEILTKNLVIEVKLGLKMKNPIFRRGGGVSRKTNIEGSVA